MENKLTHNKEENKFVLNITDGGTAFVDYETEGDTLHLVYSEVPAKYRGQGIGKELVLKTFEELTRLGYKGKAHCGYVRIIKERSEKWADIIE